MKTPAPAVTDNSDSNDVRELLAAGRAIGEPIIPPKGYTPALIVPKGYEARTLSLAELRPLPDHIRQQATLEDAESFIAYVKAFRTSTARVFAASVRLAEVATGNSGGAKFTAILDFHEGGKEQKSGRVAHIATYPVPVSVEFAAWMKLNGKAIPQMDFVAFIEANCADVVSPDSASIMELALNFEAKTSVNFQSKVDRVTGGWNLFYQEQVQDAGAPDVGQMKVPDILTLSLPVFEGGKAYEFKARMEYRPNGGRLTIAYHIQRPHVVFRKALQDLRQEIADALETEILTGSAVVEQGWDEVK